LKKRGFIDKELKLYLGNVTDVIPNGEKLCDKDAPAQCRCEHHGIFVRWNLGIWYIM